MFISADDTVVSLLTVTEEHGNQDQLWLINIGGYAVFGSTVCSDYCGYGMAHRNSKEGG